jgi:hypothetical protein
VTIEAGLNDDFRDIIEAFSRRGVEFLVVGAHALAVHGVPRATGDLDLWVRPSSANAALVMQALHDFGAPVAQHGVGQSDFERPGNVYQLGIPPRRIDILTEITAVDFAEALADKVTVEIGGQSIGFLGRKTLLANKRATGRDKDKLDADLLERKK